MKFSNTPPLLISLPHSNRNVKTFCGFVATCRSCFIFINNSRAQSLPGDVTSNTARLPGNQWLCRTGVLGSQISSCLSKTEIVKSKCPLYVLNSHRCIRRMPLKLQKKVNSNHFYYKYLIYGGFQFVDLFPSCKSDSNICDVFTSGTTSGLYT